MFTLYQVDFRYGSEIDPIQREQCLGKSNRTGLELSCSHHIGSMFVLVWQKQTYPRAQESDNEIPFQKRGRTTKQLVHIRSGAFQKAIRYRTYHFWNRSAPARNRLRNCVGPVGPNVNRRPIRYDFRGAPIIDPVQCEHSLKDR